MIQMATMIMLTPNAIPLQNGAAITIYGSGYAPNSTGVIQSTDGDFIENYKADSKGEFKITIKYMCSGKNSSGLANAILLQSVRNYINIETFDNTTNMFSNAEPLYF